MEEIDICIKEKISQLNQIFFSSVKNCMFCLQIGMESFVLGFSTRSDDLLHVIDLY